MEKSAGGMSGYFRTVLMAVLMIVTFTISGLVSEAHAHYGQGKGAQRCTNCHTPLNGTASINIAVDGVAGSTITVTEGDVIEIDYYYTGAGSKGVDGPMLVMPSTAFPVAAGTSNSAPAAWVSGSLWKSVWDKTNGRTHGWMPFTNAGEELSFGVPMTNINALDGADWNPGATSAVAVDDGVIGNSDLDGTSDTMGSDMRILIPKGTTSGTTINVYGVGHEAGSQANIVGTLTLGTVNTSAESVAPTDSGTFTATPGAATVDLAWGAATDASGIALYRVMYVEGATAPADCSTGLQVYAGPATSALHYRELGAGFNPLGSDPYSYRVCAYDTAGNVSTGMVANSVSLSGVNHELVVSDGTDPADAAVAQGAVTQYIDAFQVAEIGGSNGTSSFSAVEVSLSDFTLVDKVEIRDAAGSVILGSVTNPVSNIVNVSVTGADSFGKNDSFAYRVYVDIDAAASGTLAAVVTGITATGTAAGSGGISTDFDSATFTITGGGDVTAPVIGTVTPANLDDGTNVDATFDISATVTEANVVTATDCEVCVATDGTCDTEWTNVGAALVGPAPNYTCSWTGLGPYADLASLTINVRATDDSANTGTGTPVGRTVDAVGPVQNATPLAAATGAVGEIDLTWAVAADAGVGLHATLPYRIRQLAGGTAPNADCTSDGTEIFSNTGLLTPDTALTPGGTYSYRLCTYDAWGQLTAAGQTATANAGSANALPDDPTGLGQFLLDTVSPIALSGYTTEASVVFEADIVDSTDVGDTVKLQIDTDSDGTFNCESGLGTNPSNNVQVTCAVADGSYDWQARTVDNLGGFSAWVPFNGATPDFTKDATAPADGTLTATSGNTEIVLTWTAATDGGSGLAATAYTVSMASGTTSPPADCSANIIYTGDAATLTHTEPSLTNGIDYAFRICATNNAGLVSGGSTDTTQPAAGCSESDPTVTIQTADQDIATDGGFVNYTVQVTNNDSVACGNTTFTLSVTADTNLTNFYASTLDDTSLDIAPGSALQTVVRVTALANQPNSVTNDTTVSTAAISLKNAVSTIPAATTTINVSGGGCVAPGDYINTNGDRLTTSRR